MPRPLRALMWLSLFAAPLFVALDTSAVWNANEAFYAQTPREMVESGDWIVPSFNGELRLNKPPLSYWIVAVFYRLFEIDLFWERLPMALLALTALLSLFWMGTIFFDLKTALLAAGIFATTFRFLLVSRRLFIDTSVLAFALLGSALFCAWLQSHRRIYFLLASVAFALAVLSKGPVGLFPLPALLVLYLLSRDRPRPSRGLCTAALLLFVALAGSWFLLLGVKLGWEPVADFFLRENAGRFLNVDFGPRRGFGYYPGVFLGDFFPWSLLFLVAAGHLLYREFKDPGLSISRPYSIFLGIWVATYFGVFSLSFNKQEYYIIPVYPAAALLTAAVVRRGSLPVWVFRLLGVLMGVVALFLALLVYLVFGESLLLQLPPLLLLMGAVWLGRARMQGAVALMSLFFFTGLAVYSGPLEDYRPARPLTEEIERLAEASELENFEAGYYLFTAPSMRFYLSQDIHELFDRREALILLRSATPVFLITNGEGLASLKEAEASFRVLATRPRLSTTLRGLVRAISARIQGEKPVWSRPVYLIANSEVL